MAAFSAVESQGRDRRILPFIVVLLAIAVFVVTWIGSRENRLDSFALLTLQGKSFTEALAQASSNAILTESHYDQMVQERYSDLVSVLAEEDMADLTDGHLVRFAFMHDLYGVYVYGVDSQLVAGSVARGPQVVLPDFVEDEVAQLISDPESNFVLLLDQTEPAQTIVHYYLELTNRLDRVVVLVIDAAYYAEALEQTGIGYLARNMSREPGVEYIIYQSTEGIIFASRKPGSILAIESDLFLTASLDIDSINSRTHMFLGTEVLELVRPFSTDQYPFGLFRVGLSLDGYYSISRGYDLQMAALSVVLFGLVLVAILYLNSREKRRLINRRYTRMKSVTDKIFEQMQTGVAVVDDGGEVRMVNHAFEAIFGVWDITGRRFSEVVDSATLDLTDELVRKGMVRDSEITLACDSALKTLLVTRSEISHEDTGLKANLLVVYDITRLKEFERQAARKERLSEMGDLAAGVAHEIRNPLNTISIAIQRLAGEFKPEENSQEFLSFTEKIRAETKRLNEIITRFLALAREEGKRLRSVKVDALVKEVVSFLNVEAERLNIDLSEQANSGAEIKADPDQLKQVMVNLFNNAKEAFEGKPGKIEVIAEISDGVLVVRFVDDGPGISAELREKVFTPYFTTKEAGTGLGLPTVHKIVSELGGEVSLGTSRLGGTEFTIALPLSDIP